MFALHDQHIAFNQMSVRLYELHRIICLAVAGCGRPGGHNRVSVKRRYQKQQRSFNCACMRRTIDSLNLLGQIRHALQMEALVTRCRYLADSQTA
jgi:hypothetical protein